MIEPLRPLSGHHDVHAVETERRYRVETELEQLTSESADGATPEALVVYGEPAEEIAKVHFRGTLIGGCRGCCDNLHRDVRVHGVLAHACDLTRVASLAWTLALFVGLLWSGAGIALRNTAARGAATIAGPLRPPAAHVVDVDAIDDHRLVLGVGETRGAGSHQRDRSLNRWSARWRSSVFWIIAISSYRPKITTVVQLKRSSRSSTSTQTLGFVRIHSTFFPIAEKQNRHTCRGS